MQLVAGSSVTTRTVADFAERFGEARSAESIVIDVSELEDVDLTFIQIVDAYRADFGAKGRSLALSSHDNQHIKSLLSRCGYLEGADSSGVAFWTGEVSE